MPELVRAPPERIRRATRSIRTGLGRPVVGLRRPGRVAVEGGRRGGDGVRGVGLAAPAAGLPVRPDHLGHLHALASQVAGQRGPSRRERLGAQHVGRLVGHGRDVHLGVGVHPPVAS